MGQQHWGDTWAKALSAQEQFWSCHILKCHHKTEARSLLGTWDRDPTRHRAQDCTGRWQLQSGGAKDCLCAPNMPTLLLDQGVLSWRTLQYSSYWWGASCVLAGTSRQAQELEAGHGGAQAEPSLKLWGDRAPELRAQPCRGPTSFSCTSIQSEQETPPRASSLLWSCSPGGL